MHEFSILLVDDSEIDRYILKRTVEEISSVEMVLEVENGQEAIDFLTNYESGVTQLNDKFPPIIIFLDVNMPVLDGFGFLEVFEKLRDADTRYHKVNVLMYSSSDHPSDIMKFAQYKFVNDVVTKGVSTSEQIQVKIENILKQAA